MYFCSDGNLCKLEKEEQIKPKIEGAKIKRAKINVTLKKTDEPLAVLIKKKRKEDTDYQYQK